MNLVYIAFASTFVAAAFSWNQEEESKLLGAWSDDEVRVAVYAEGTNDRWPHRLVLENDRGTIRKWGRWEEGTFYGPAIGTMPSTITGESELVSVERPRGRLTCHNLMAHGISAESELDYEMKSWRE